LNFSLWILFVLDYLLLEITTPLIVYIWRRHGGTCKFGFEFHWNAFFIEILQYDWLWSDHMIIKEIFHIPMKLKSKLARASMTTSDHNICQWTSILLYAKVSNVSYKLISSYLRIECILLKCSCLFCWYWWNGSPSLFKLGWYFS
jgi:hypothetical protein